MNRPARVIAAFSLLAGVLSGCGYTMSSTLDERYQTIHVAAFQNQSREYDLQAPLTNAVIRKFLNDGRLRVVGPGEADLVVTGTILDYSLRGLTFDADDEVTQFQTFVTASVEVIDAQSGDVLWRDARLTGQTSYVTARTGGSSDRLRGNAQSFLPAVRSFQTDEENQAASEALERIATDIFYRTIEPW
jgi:hypothetical protein